MKKERKQNRMGNGQCLYTHNGMEISMIYPCDFTNFCYEIYCNQGNLFEDIERYLTETEAEDRIKQLFGIEAQVNALENRTEQ